VTQWVSDPRFCWRLHCVMCWIAGTLTSTVFRHVLFCLWHSEPVILGFVDDYTVSCAGLLVLLWRLQYLDTCCFVCDTVSRWSLVLLTTTLSWSVLVWMCMSRCMTSVGLSGQWPCKTFRMLCSGMKITRPTSQQCWMIILSFCGLKKVCSHSSV